MQRSLSLAAGLSLLALTATLACNKDKQADSNQQAGEPAGAGPSEQVGEPGGEGEAQPAEPGAAEAGATTADTGAATAGAEAGAAEAGAEAGAGEVGAGEAGAGEAGAAEAGAAEPTEAEPEEDVIPGLFEQAKSLDTSDDAAKKALSDALAAGAAKVDAAKTANARGEALMAAGEAERASEFFKWAAATHSLLSEPVYNLATLAAYAGDLELAKEHLQELQKRGNKKLMKKVGVDPAFAPLHDDPEVRKIYEQ